MQRCVQLADIVAQLQTGNDSKAQGVIQLSAADQDWAQPSDAVDG
jgi:hypothetical protein